MKIWGQLLLIPLSLLALSQSGWAKAKTRIKIAIIDTGVDFDHDLLNTVVRIPRHSDGIDETGHGTHIAGIIVEELKNSALDKNLEIIPIKFFKSGHNNAQLTESFVHALKRAIDEKVDIIHISAGGPQASQAELNMLLKAQQSDILVVAAAGNKSVTDHFYSFYPAAYQLNNVLSVVGTDKNGRPLGTSNINAKKMNLFYPGKNIRSALPGNRFGLLTGSSQAAAFATAEIAKIWLQQGRRVAQKTFHFESQKLSRTR